MADQTFTAGQILTAAQMTTLQTNTGLNYVSTKTFSGSGTVSCTSFFSSAYKNYKLVISCTSASSSAQIIETRLMVGASATSGTTNYKYYELGHSFAAGAADAAAGPGGAYWFSLRSTDFFMGTMEIQNPYASDYTTYQSRNVDSVQSVSSAGVHLLTTSYDGIQFLAGTGTLAGTIDCYGYRV